MNQSPDTSKMASKSAPAAGSQVDCPIEEALIRQNSDDILKSKELLKKLNSEIRKTLDKIDAILGCKGYHDVDEFYKK